MGVARGYNRRVVIGVRIGPYTIDAELGAGGMGRVYRASDESGAPVALKVLHAHLLDSCQAVDRFRREAEIGQRVVHPNVVRTLAVGEATHRGTPVHYLATEYVEGQTLRRLLEELGTVPEQLCRHIGREIARGLEAIHAAGVVHRDLKPENVLLTPSHEVKIMDLGVARLQEAAMRLSQSGAFTGSVLYAAPEQFEARELDARADHYALGLMLFELATGEHPSGAEDFAGVAHRRLHEHPPRADERNPELSRFFAEFVDALLEREPARRPAEPRVVLEDGERSDWWQRRRHDLHEPRAPRIRVARDAALHGREAELARLEQLWSASRAGDARVVIVEGEAGIGTTRLVGEFTSRLVRAGEVFHFLHGSYPPGGAATAAGALSTAYREHFGEEGSRPWLRETPRLVPAFDALLRGEPAPLGELALQRDSILTVFVHATRALARDKPVLLFLDDLQFAPEEGRAIFMGLAHALPGHRVLVLAASRPGLPPAWTAALDRLPHFVRVPLSRLGNRTVERLMTDLLGAPARELAGNVAERSDGNPFFVFEIARSLKDAGACTGRDLPGIWKRLSIPSTIVGLIEARLAELDEEERELLEVAACVGFTFDPVLVAEVAGSPIVPALKRLARIERASALIRAAGRTYRFDHHQVREVLHGGLPAVLRERLHGAIAERLLLQAPDAAEGALAVRLCDHFLEAGQPHRALRDLDAALHHLEAGYLNDQVVALARRLLGAGDAVHGERRVELLLRVGARLEHLGRADEERTTLEEALAEAEGLPSPLLAARARDRLGWHAIRTLRLDEADALLRRALAAAHAAGDLRLEGTITGNLGNAAFSRDRYEEARALAERHRALARSTGDLRGQATATGNLGNALRALHRYEEARDCYEKSHELFLQLGDGRGQAISIGNLGNVFEYLGRHDEACTQYERHLELSREIGYRRGETIATGNLGLVRGAQGRLVEAREHLERGLLLSREVGDRLGEVTTMENLGPILLTLGRVEEGRRMLEDALEKCDAMGERRIAGYLLTDLAGVRIDEGAYAGAEPLLERALELRRATGDRAAQAATLAERGRLRAALADRDGACADFEQAVSLGDEVGSIVPPVRALVERALLDPAYLPEALRRYDDARARLAHVHRMALRFRLWRAGAGPDHLERARALLSRILSDLMGEEREVAASRVPLHRAILAAEPAE